MAGPELLGKDFNFFQEITVQTTDTSFPYNYQAISKFRGARRIILVCTSGAIEYSWNGSAVHGKMECGASNQLLDFGTRSEDKVWVRWAAGVTTVPGPGILQVHMWHPGI